MKDLCELYLVVALVQWIFIGPLERSLLWPVIVYHDAILEMQQ